MNGPLNRKWGVWSASELRVCSAVSLLLPRPGHEVENRFVGQKFVERIVITPQFLLAGNELVYGVMAITAEVDGLLHFFARELLLEPFVPVASPGNQVMLCRAVLHHAAAEFAGSGVGTAHQFASDIDTLGTIISR